MPQQEGSGGESASGGGTGGGETAPAVPKSLGPKLTESQLYDLYQRLDINGQYPIRSIKCYLLLIIKEFYIRRWRTRYARVHTGWEEIEFRQ